jgi:hypothetical protein
MTEPTQPPADPKSGYKTTEAWLAATAITGLLALGAEAMWPIAAIAIGYSFSRAMTKRGTR